MALRTAGAARVALIKVPVGERDPCRLPTGRPLMTWSVRPPENSEESVARWLSGPGGDVVGLDQYVGWLVQPNELLNVRIEHFWTFVREVVAPAARPSVSTTDTQRFAAIAELLRRSKVRHIGRSSPVRSARGRLARAARPRQRGQMAGNAAGSSDAAAGVGNGHQRADRPSMRHVTQGEVGLRPVDPNEALVRKRPAGAGANGPWAGGPVRPARPRRSCWVPTTRSGPSASTRLDQAGVVAPPNGNDTVPGSPIGTGYVRPPATRKFVDPGRPQISALVAVGPTVSSW